jgi:hypothetical protein
LGHRITISYRNLITTLKQKDIISLANVEIEDVEKYFITSWKNVDFLGLVGEQKDEWDKYIKGLVGSGFFLNSEKDSILWS